jgi:hypothetical protein
MPPSPKLLLALKVVAVLLVVLLLAFLVLSWVPSWLVEEDGLTAAQRLTAANDARTPLVALLVAFGAAGTLYYTSRSYRLNADGHVTDRYSRAVDQLGDDEHMSVRVGGVYALERIGVDSPRDRPRILHILSIFIRTRSLVPQDAVGEANDDLKAALLAATTLLGLAPAEVLDLSGANLSNCDISRIRKDQLDLGDPPADPERLAP